MTKVLYISRDVKGIHTGASVVTNRNCQLLKDVFGAENVLEKHIYPVRSKSKLLSLTLKKYMGGLTPEIEQEVVKLVSDHHIPVIAIDSSLLGRLSKVLKKKFPACRIMVFFHNTEYYYFKSLLTTTRKIWHYSSVRAALYNERLSCEYADDLITLNERDADDLYKVYTRKGDLVIPVTYADRFDPSKVVSQEEVTALFVGTLFFPNYQGIKWFIDCVQPHIKCKLVIVGKGFEEKRKELSSNQVEVVGTTSNIDAYYYKSSFVIAPIFNGSGMKTKTAEALMFGKTIFGTKEAFEGYDVDPGKVGALCNDADAFIRAVNHFIKHKAEANFNELSRSYFLENHDYKSALNKFRTYVLQHSIEQV